MLDKNGNVITIGANVTFNGYMGIVEKIYINNAEKQLVGKIMMRNQYGYYFPAASIVEII
jgi:hypothetical protein